MWGISYCTLSRLVAIVRHFLCFENSLKIETALYLVQVRVRDRAACLSSSHPEPAWTGRVVEGEERVAKAGSRRPGLDGPGLDGPGLDGPGLDGPGLDGPGLDGPDPKGHTRSYYFILLGFSDKNAPQLL